MVVKTEQLYEQPTVMASASLDKYGLVDKIHLDGIVIWGRDREDILVSQSLDIEIELDMSREESELEGDLLEALWFPEKIILDYISGDYDISFLDPDVTDIVVDQINVEFTVAGREWFETGNIPILDLNLNPASVLELIIAACHECGRYKYG